MRVYGLRPRFTLIATALAALAFGTGGAIALRIYHDSLVATVDSGVRSAAQEVAAAAGHSTLPEPVIPMPVAQEVPRIQVLDGHGRVVTGDPASAAAPAMTALAARQSGHLITITSPPGLPERSAVVYIIRTSSPRGRLTVIAAASLDDADAKTTAAVEVSASAGSGSLTVVAAVAWLTAGLILRRVERLRRQVCTITDSGDLARRVPADGGDELASLGATLNQMLAALEAAAERRRRFVADAAHELRTPLAGLTAALEVAVHHPETAAEPGWTAELAEGHRRLGRLVNDLLELAGLDGRASRRHGPVELAGLVEDSVRRSAQGGVDLRAGLVEHATVDGDETQLTRLVANLVDNALRHARSAVEVSVTTDDCGHATITVADDGPGIPEPDRDRVWGRFVRLDDDRSRASGGTGLGLALVKEIAAAHDGAVDITDAPAGGAAVIVRLHVCLPGVTPCNVRPGQSVR
jgi:signal transduction histidine kinase